MSIFRSCGQPNQLYSCIYCKLFKGFFGKTDLTVEKYDRTPNVLQKPQTLQNEKSEGNCLNKTFLVVMEIGRKLASFWVLWKHPKYWQIVIS